MDISRASRADGANVQLYTSNNTKAQRFVLEPVSNTNARTGEAVAKATTSSEELPSAFELYPNPAHQSVELFFPKAEKAQFELYDLTGRLLLHKNYTNQQTGKVMIDDLQAGVYLVRLQADEKSYQRRLVVK